MNKEQQISVLLVDDEPRFRQGLQTLLNFYNANNSWQFYVVGETGSVEQALNLTKEQKPALILLDLEMPPDNGLTALQKLKELPYKGKVLVLSGHHEEEWVFKAMKAGAYGYVFKDRLVTELHDAIATVINNQVYLSPEVATQFFRMYHFYTGCSLKAVRSIHLTEREQEVLHWLVEGDSNEIIAKRLYVTIATVKAHLTAIFEKLGVKSRTQAIIKALKLGLVST